MATASKRKLACQNIVTALRTITPGATYFRNLTIADNVTTKYRLLDQSQEGWSFIWVRPGREEMDRTDISAGTHFEGIFEILLDVIVKDASGDTMVEELEDLLHDVSLCIGDDLTLGGAVSDAKIVSIDAPVYGLEEQFAVTTVHVRCTYDYTYGTSI